MSGSQSKMTGVLIRRGDQDIDTHEGRPYENMWRI